MHMLETAVRGTRFSFPLVLASRHYAYPFLYLSSYLRAHRLTARC